jgi:diguanylate cyclase (GGDEF)-like protein
LIWCYVELVRREEVPQVSIADLFFLSFTAVMAFAVWPSGGRHTDRLRTLLDAFIIGMSLFAISWATTINHVTSESDGATLLGVLINLAYPCGDVVVLTIVLLGVSRGTHQRSSLTVVAAAMALIAVSDGFYAYMSASSSFDPGSVTGLGWIAGFGLIGCAALVGAPAPGPGMRSGMASGGSSTVASAAGTGISFRPDPRQWAPQSRAASILPYLPLAVALIIIAADRYSDGSDRVTGIVVVLTFIGVLIRQYLTIRDNVTLTRHLESRERDLERQAFADQLTGLPNRALFTDRVGHALEQHRRNLRPLALLFVDLDDFKAVNDTLGHPVGDELVIRVGERLRGAVRASDTVARFGGDEFAVLIEGDSDAVKAGSRLVECLRPAFLLAGEHLSVGASIGLAEVTGEQETPELDELFSRADIAMYAAKRSGKGQLALYEPSMVLPEAADLHYRPLLIDAVQAGDIECVFQPIIELGTGRVHAMEALARWSIGGRPVTQDYFIKLAGRLGLLTPLTDLMVERACAQLADWSTRLHRDDLRVCVNVPPGLMTDRDFPDRISTTLRRHGLDAGSLILEITEDALIGETIAARPVADRLRAMGLQLWLDDFGTGYSSLLSLRQISLQAVKIDIAFVSNVHTDPDAARFLRALLALGRDLDLTVVAEGVELPEQAQILGSLGCELVQGFLYAHPAPAADFDQILAAAPAHHQRVVAAGG